MKTIYRWSYCEKGNRGLEGIVLAETWDEAVEETKSYILDMFSDINKDMHLYTHDDTKGGLVKTTLWVWEADSEDDYDENNHPNCLITRCI